ncbi:RND family efflux transporter MFP subunit [Sedimentibacter acidaminivorans]|jgi:HlyD family secretion protein|uniref:RND family efflux transporter MFP subunit n=1 Tax=Sedimentibacter acidaminivorans TaxID=913099 RepID=A0ABS4GBA8_9FIRM|nr:efflux RND transporter periplasmic adaptor subunit [Sedimentibacter acidaminivorans]MBP1924954.1 RND family efflux transporter MFP subunit [Sedimentibacter acidaminivorans]
MVKKVISIIIVLAIVFGGGYLTAKQLVPDSTQVATGPKYSTKPVVIGDIKQGVNITGQLNGNWGGSITAPKPEGVTDLNGGSVTVVYNIEELFVEPNDMVRKGDDLVRLSTENLEEIIDKLNEGITKKHEEIQEINDEIDSKLEALSKKINKDITNISQVNPYEGIVISAPIKGRLLDFRVEEGERIEDPNIVTIVDDSKVKISFKVNSYEYENMKVGQKVLLQFRRVLENGNTTTAFDGFYSGTIKKLNPNAVPNSDSMTYVHNGVIEADNPGLVQKGMVAVVYTENEGIPVASLSYQGKVESFVNEKKVYSTIYSDGDNANIIATEVPVSENEFVDEGQILVRIAGNDVTELIEEDIDKIKAEYDKIKTKNEEIESIQEKIDKALSLSSKLMVTAPMDGMVSYVNYRVGDTISASESSDEWSLQLMDMYNTSEMNIYTTVSDLDVLYIKQDAPVSITVDALPGEEFDGKVMRLDQYTDRDGKTVYRVEISVEGKEGLRPGMNTNCFVDSGESLDTLLVPIEAVFEEDNKQKVEILSESGEVEVVEIEVGLMNDKQVEVLSGLEEGQQVVTGSTKDLMPSQSVPENDSLLPTTNE